MKTQFVTYSLVLLYLVAMLRPIAPFVEYAINYDYISKVLCINKDTPKLNCNGKCYLMQELEKQQENDFKSLRVVMEDYPIGFVECLSFETIVAPLLNSRHQFSYKELYSFQLIPSIFHPPTTSFL